MFRYLFPASARSQRLESVGSNRGRIGRRIRRTTRLPMGQAGTDQELPRRRHQVSSGFGQKRRHRPQAPPASPRIRRCHPPDGREHRLPLRSVINARPKSETWLPDARRCIAALGSPTMSGGKSQLLLQLAQQLAAQIDHAIIAHRTGIHAAGRRQLPHPGLVDRRAVPPPYHHAPGATQCPAHRQRPHVETRKAPAAPSARRCGGTRSGGR